MNSKHDLNRFLSVQNLDYSKALSEITNGRKVSHWMWYIFPQLKGLGRSNTAKFYGIEDLNEATAYLEHPVLGKHLIEITSELLEIEGKSATEIFGKPDDMKLRSCMTLFAQMAKTNPVFQKVIAKYFSGLPDELTLQLLAK